MRRVDITLGLFPNDCSSDSRYSLKGLWQKSWFLQIYLLALGFGFLETLETFGNPWNAPTFRSIFGQAFRHPATRGDRPKPAGGTAWSLSTGHCSSPSTCLEINKRHVFLLQLLDDWINIDSAICMESSDVNCKFCGFCPFFFHCPPPIWPPMGGCTARPATQLLHGIPIWVGQHGALLLLG